VADAPLGAALAARGIEIKRFDERSSMLRVVDVTALERIAGVPRAAGESEVDYLARLVPPHRFVFWAADRF
jgi:hypothetical protein